MTPPVLLLAFNRPDKASRVLAAIGQAAPARLYLAVDGPRPGRADDADAVARTLALADAVDWPCEVTVLAQPVNRGCGDAVAAGITWFFEHEQAGIVLEDDCVPAPDFFPFCQEMLQRHAEDQRIWMVSGCNLLGSWRADEGTHVLAEGGAWGWATWADRWSRYDATMPDWQERGEEVMATMLGRRFWEENRPGYDGTAAGLIDTWDYQWSWARLRHGGLTVIPTRNLVTNIGTGHDSTHGSFDDDLFVHAPTHELSQPFVQVGDGLDRAFMDALARKQARNRRRMRRRALQYRVQRRLVRTGGAS